ncbi:MAG: glycosyltransferase family 4 protein [Candidatus Levyibacteriota bacterium]
MKIGIYDPYLEDLGGGEKYVASIAECLSRDNSVTVFWNNKEDLGKIGKRFSLDLSRVSISANIFSKEFGFINRLKESKKYDAIIFLSDGSIPFVFSKLFVHIQQPFVALKPGLKTKLKIRRISKIFYNSNYTREFVDKTFGVKGVVLYPPIDIKAKGIKKENIILTVGRFRGKDLPLDDFKKLKVMIDSFKEMVEKGLKGWKFIVVTGFSKEYEEDFEKIKGLASGFPIEFLLNKPIDELWDIYSRAKIYWHAAGYGEDLSVHPEYAEHFGISTVEAMGAGTVPVVISAGGQKEIVDEKSGFLWNTLEELKNKAEKLIEDEPLLEKMSESARKRAQIFAGDRFCEELNKIIK